MTLKEINAKYSATELKRMPGDKEFRYQTFSPFFENLHENKIVYFERFICIAQIDNLIITPDSFKASAKPYLVCPRPDMPKFYSNPKAKWSFGAKWEYVSLTENHFGTYGMWTIWPEKDFVITIEYLLKNGHNEMVLDLLLGK